jgi:flagellar capping protein FliD
VKGLSLTAPSGTLSTSTVFTFQKGLSELLELEINKLTDSRDGLVSMRQESWRKNIQYSDDRILKLEDRIEKYRLRLVRQFSDMEQAMSRLQSQSSNLLNALSALQ